MKPKQNAQALVATSAHPLACSVVDWVVRCMLLTRWSDATMEFKRA